MNTWSTAAGPEDSAGSAGMAVVNDQIYRIGGLSHNESVSPSYAQLDECLRYTPAGYSTVPEFPSWMVPPLIIVAITISIAVISIGLTVYYVKAKKKKSQP